MIRLALLRHGHTAWNRAGRIQGRRDMPLEPDAAAALARLQPPAPWQSADLWSSPLSRAAHTATLVTGRAPKITPALTEMDWGDWEGRKARDLHDDPTSGFRDIDQWGWDFTPPGGESPAMLRDRLAPWVAGLRRDTLAVCHIGVMRVLLAQATGWGFNGPAPFAVKRNRLYLLSIDGDKWQMDERIPRLEPRG